MNYLYKCVAAVQIMLDKAAICIYSGSINNRIL